MDNRNLIKALRFCAHQANGWNCPSCPGFDGLCSAGKKIRTIAADALEAMSAQLAEKDGQIADLETQHRVEYCESTGYDCEVRGRLAAVVEALESVAHSGGNFCELCGSDCCDAGLDDPDTFQCGCFKWRGVQEASTQAQAPPTWAEQFERRFLAGEGTT